MQKVANLSVLSPVFCACITYTLFIEIPRYLEIPPRDFFLNFIQQKTFIQRIRSVKHFKRKCPTGLKFDLELKPL